MSLDFTGERIVPGKVDAHLYNEHLARYLFASRLAQDCRCLDVACGVGYGAAELAPRARTVDALDVSFAAVAEGKAMYQSPRIRWVHGSATALPYAGEQFDLITAFEVIEHLSEWRQFLHELHRVLAPGGLLLVSTPNRSTYAELRGEAGPNPFHEHEFEAGEFASVLADVFERTEIWTQSSAEVELIVPPEHNRFVFENRMHVPHAETSVFLLGICGKSQASLPKIGLAFLPEQGHLLLERLEHIRRLQQELQQKDKWLKEQQFSHLELLEKHEHLNQELRKSNDWATELGTELAATREAYARDQTLAQAEITRLNDEHSSYVRRATALLEQSEATVRERTLWAHDLDAELNDARNQLEQQRALIETQATMLLQTKTSRWVRLGRRLHVGPDLP